MDGRHVVVTGGTGGLGRAVVAQCLAGGAYVHVPSRRSEAPDWIQASERAIFHGDLSLTDEDGIKTLYANIDRVWASIHLAGGFAMGPIVETSLDDFREQIEMNLTSAFLCLREATRNMKAHGGGGRIVNVIARPALSPCGGMIAYATTKGALATLTQCASEELRAEGIFVNAVAPSIIDTATNRQAMPDADHGAWTTPDELARTILFLASPINEATSGALLPTYGRT